MLSTVFALALMFQLPPVPLPLQTYQVQQIQKADGVVNVRLNPVGFEGTVVTLYGNGPIFAELMPGSTLTFQPKPPATLKQCVAGCGCMDGGPCICPAGTCPMKHSKSVVKTKTVVTTQAAACSCSPAVVRQQTTIRVRSTAQCATPARKGPLKRLLGR